MLASGNHPSQLSYAFDKGTGEVGPERRKARSMSIFRLLGFVTLEVEQRAPHERDLHG